MSNVVIAGAGISGLTLAYLLEREGKSVTIFEAEQRIGGAVQSKSIDGFQLELGPNSVLERPDLARITQLLELENEIVRPSPNTADRFLALRRSIKKGPALHPAPRSLRDCLQTPILRLPAKLRILLEPLLPTRVIEDESVYEYVTRRFGRDTATDVVAPMLSGIWAADITKLSVRSALPTLWQTEQNGTSLLRSMLSKRTSGKKRPALISFRDGMKVLPESLAVRLDPGTLSLGRYISRIEPGATQTAVYVRDPGNDHAAEECHWASNVVLTGSAAHCARLVAPYDSAFAAALQSIPYAPLGVLHLAYRKEDVQHALQGFGFLVAPSCQFALLGAIFSSSLFPKTAPEGYHLVTCFCGGATNPHFANVTSTDVEQRIVAEVSSLLGAKGAKVLQKTYWPSAIPNYEPGHFKIQQASDDFEARYPSVRFLSNWRSGISVPDRLEQASILAKRLVAEHGENQLSAISR